MKTASVAACLLIPLHCGPASAETLVVQCMVDAYRSSFSPRPDLFTVQVDTDERTIVTNYGAMSLRMTKRALRGIAAVDGGWHTRVDIDRNSGRLVANIDKVEPGKYVFAELKGTCILPPGLQGPRYARHAP